MRRQLLKRGQITTKFFFSELVLLCLCFYIPTVFASTFGSTVPIQRSKATSPQNYNYQTAPAGVFSELHFLTGTTQNPPTTLCSSIGGALVYNSLIPVSGMSNAWEYECMFMPTNKNYISIKTLENTAWNTGKANAGGTDYATLQYPNGLPLTTFQTLDTIALSTSASSIIPAVHTASLNTTTITNSTPATPATITVSMKAYPNGQVQFTKKVTDTTTGYPYSGVSYTCTGTGPTNSGWVGQTVWVDCCPISTVSNPWLINSSVSVTGTIASSTSWTGAGPCGGTVTTAQTAQPTTFIMQDDSTYWEAGGTSLINTKLISMANTNTYGYAGELFEMNINGFTHPYLDIQEGLQAVKPNTALSSGITDNSNGGTNLTAPGTMVGITPVFTQVGVIPIKGSLLLTAGTTVRVIKSVTVMTHYDAWNDTYGVGWSCWGNLTITAAMIGQTLYVNCCPVGAPANEANGSPAPVTNPYVAWMNQLNGSGVTWPFFTFNGTIKYSTTSQPTCP